jgi:hypothetical protein
MKTSLIAIIALMFLPFLKAAEPAAPMVASGEGKIEKREFLVSELRDIRLDMDDGALSFTVEKTTYTYQPSLSTGTYSAPRSEKIAVGATFLSELRHASRVIVEVSPSSGDRVYTQFMTLQFDSIR